MVKNISNKSTMAIDTIMETEKRNGYVVFGDGIMAYAKDKDLSNLPLKNFKKVKDNPLMLVANDDVIVTAAGLTRMKNSDGFRLLSARFKSTPVKTLKELADKFLD